MNPPRHVHRAVDVSRDHSGVVLRVGGCSTLLDRTQALELAHQIADLITEGTP